MAHREYMQQYAAKRRASYERGEILLPQSKRCSTCRAVKSASQFGLRFYNPDCLAYNCKACHALIVREWRANRACDTLNAHT